MYDFRFGLFLLAATIGPGLGYLLPLFYGFQKKGFVGGMILGLPFSGIGTVLVGTLFAGELEESLEHFGVPLGLFLGCFLGALGSNFFLGGIGYGIARCLSAIKSGSDSLLIESVKCSKKDAEKLPDKCMSELTD